jgi:hypothetical protein
MKYPREYFHTTENEYVGIGYAYLRFQATIKNKYNTHETLRNTTFTAVEPNKNSQPNEQKRKISFLP